MSEKPAYAILRIGKIKSLTTLDAVEWHNTRQIPTGTVDGLPPPEDLVTMSGTYRERVARVLTETGATYEKGKVLAVEVLVTASPEWWERSTHEEKEEWWKTQLRFASDLFGPGLIAFTPHVDESTPHAQFVGLPLYFDIKRTPGPKPKKTEDLTRRADEEARAGKIWRLSHDRVFGGSAKRLADLQTTYHGYVKHLGLARGRDTVGVGIKHTTLKHYKKLLTQMDQDLAREAAELREERQVFDHDNAELRDKHDRFHEDQLDLCRQKEVFRIKRKALETRQHELEARALNLDARQSALDQRERGFDEAIAVREKALGEVQVRLGEGQQQLAMDREHQNDRNREADDRESMLEKREMAAGAQERALRLEESRQKSIAAQLNIVGGLFVGRLSGKWDKDRQRPQITKGELSPEEKEALSQIWPDWLKMAVKRAAEVATVRETIARQARRIIVAFKRKREAARLALAAANDRVTQALEKEAQAARIIATARRDEIAIANAANAAAARVMRADAEAAHAERTRDEAIRQQSEALRTRAHIESEAVLLRNEVTALRSEQSNVATNVTTLREARTILETDLAILRSEKCELEEDRRQLERDQKVQAQAASRLDRSRALLDDLFADKILISLEQGRLRIAAGPAAPHREPMHVARTEVEPWVEAIVQQHGGLVAALDRAEEVEMTLQETRAALSVRYPQLAEELGKEQVAETKGIDQRLVRQPPMIDGMGM